MMAILFLMILFIVVLVCGHRRCFIVCAAGSDLVLVFDPIPQ